MGAETRSVERTSQATPLSSDVLSMLQGQLSQGAFGQGVGPMQRESGTAMRQWMQSRGMLMDGPQSGPQTQYMPGLPDVNTDSRFADIRQIAGMDGPAGRLGQDLMGQIQNQLETQGQTQPTLQAYGAGQEGMPQMPVLTAGGGVQGLTPPVLRTDMGPGGMAPPIGPGVQPGQGRGGPALDGFLPQVGAGGVREADLPNPADFAPGAMPEGFNLGNVDLGILDGFTGDQFERFREIANTPLDMGDVGQLRARDRTGALEARLRDNAAVDANRQAADLRESMGAAGTRFGSALATGEGIMRGDIQRQLNETIARSLVDRDNQIMNAQAQLDVAGLNAGTQGRGQTLNALLNARGQNLQGSTAGLGALMQGRGQDLQSLLGQRGQDVQGRGQDIQFGLGALDNLLRGQLGARGQDIQLRGQDVNQRGQDVQTQGQLLNHLIQQGRLDLGNAGLDLQGIQAMQGMGNQNIAPFLQMAQLGILPAEIMQTPNPLTQLLGAGMGAAGQFLGGPAGAALMNNVL